MAVLPMQIAVSSCVVFFSCVTELRCAMAGSTSVACAASLTLPFPLDLSLSQSASASVFSFLSLFSS